MEAQQIHGLPPGIPIDGAVFNTSGIQTFVFNHTVHIHAIHMVIEEMHRREFFGFDNLHEASISVVEARALAFDGVDTLFLDTMTTGEYKDTVNYRRIIAWARANTAIVYNENIKELIRELYFHSLERRSAEMIDRPIAENGQIGPYTIQQTDNRNPYFDLPLAQAYDPNTDLPQEQAAVTQASEPAQTPEPESYQIINSEIARRKTLNEEFRRRYSIYSALDTHETENGYLAIHCSDEGSVITIKRIEQMAKLCEIMKCSLIYAKGKQEMCDYAQMSLGASVFVILLNNPDPYQDSFAYMSNCPISIFGRTSCEYMMPREQREGGTYRNYDRVLFDHHTEVAFACIRKQLIFILVTRILFTECLKAMVERYDMKSYDVVALAKKDKEIHDLIFNETLNSAVNKVVSKQNQQLDIMKHEFNNLIPVIEEQRNGLASMLKRYNELSEILGICGDSKIIAEQKAKLADQIRALAGIKKIISIEYNSDDETLNVYTSDIYVKHPERPEEVYDIGRFLIKIYMNGAWEKKKTIAMLNLKHKVIGFNDQYMEAPHVYADGHACFGNFTELLAEEYGRGNIYALVMGCIIFLESVNTADPAGKMITRWPRVEAPKEVVRIDEMDDAFDTTIAQPYIPT